MPMRKIQPALFAFGITKKGFVVSKKTSSYLKIYKSQIFRKLAKIFHKSVI